MSDEQEYFEERAAVRQYMGGFSREEAERMAREDLEAWRAGK